MPLPRDSFAINEDKTKASVWVEDLCLIDTSFFSGPYIQPSKVSFQVTFEAVGPAAELGKGLEVDPTDKAAFTGTFSPAVAVGSFSGSEVGFSFRSKPGASSAPDGYAQVGTELNGEFLKDSV